MNDRKNIRIVTPVYNDWLPLVRLAIDIDKAIDGLNVEIDMLVVDDGSAEVPADLASRFKTLRNIGKVELIHLMTNQGHQRAIAIGLARTYQAHAYDAAIIMDSDGEDRPEEIPELINAFSSSSSAVVVAQRTERSEGMAFRFFYGLYKLLFRSLTGRLIDFGNFCIIDASTLERLVYSPGAWNHIAATIMLLNPKLKRMQSRRGRRYAGESRMNAVALINHGLSAISVFSAIAVTRILIICSAIATVLILLSFLILGIRLLTDLATPGWATTVVLSLTVLVSQLIILSGGASLMIMGNRSLPLVLPVSIADCLIKGSMLLVKPKSIRQTRISTAS
jgi:glycosyltransferase involved in cell wall biosynthesis